LTASPEDLYTLTDDLPDLGSPVLVHALPGFVDAGGAVRLAVDHLLATRPNQVIARFDHDVLVDYRGGRPSLVFSEDHYADYTPPEITLRVFADADGTPFLLLSGREPDFQWERFADAVIGLTDRLNVRLTVGLLAIPMTVPHTRPVTVTGHGTKPGLVPTDGNLFRGDIRVPAAMASMLEVRMGEAGKDAGGFAVHVPHYLAQAEYPDASITLPERLCAASGLSLPTTELAETAVVTRAAIDAQVTASAEVQDVVTQLERQYDSMIGLEGAPPLDESSLPSAEQIGAELERFLSGLDEGRGGH
jgi:hypothetical protein